MQRKQNVHKHLLKHDEGYENVLCGWGNEHYKNIYGTYIVVNLILKTTYVYIIYIDVVVVVVG